MEHRDDEERLECIRKHEYETGRGERVGEMEYLDVCFDECLANESCPEKFPKRNEAVPTGDSREVKQWIWNLFIELIKNTKRERDGRREEGRRRLIPMQKPK